MSGVKPGADAILRAWRAADAAGAQAEATNAWPRIARRIGRPGSTALAFLACAVAGTALLWAAADFPRKGLPDSRRRGLMGLTRDPTMKSIQAATASKFLSATLAATAMLAPDAMAQNAAKQWRLADGGNGHWYQVVPTGSGIDWPTARSAAVALNGHLATVTSATEDSFVASIASAPGAWNSNYGPWLGGFQDRSATDYAEPRGGWRWVSGEEWTWAQWDAPNSDEPNDCYCYCGTEDFLHYKAPQRWNDFNGTNATNCIQPVAFLVEWSADCNSDGIVDYGQCRNGTLADYDGNNVPDCCERGEPCVVAHCAVESRVEDGGNGHWYRFDSPHVNWDVQRRAATAAGGYLACIAAGVENSFVRNLIPIGDVAYLGAIRTASGWS